MNTLTGFCIFNSVTKLLYQNADKVQASANYFARPIFDEVNDVYIT